MRMKSVPLSRTRPSDQQGLILLLLTAAVSLYSFHFDHIAVNAIKWIALSNAPRIWNASRHCPQDKLERRKFGLIGKQAKICKRASDLMPSIMLSARDTRIVCEEMFGDRRWNCSSIRTAPRLTPDLTRGTREQAFVFSLSSAAVVHGVAKACSRGTIPWCPCGLLPKGQNVDFKWKGCSDNIDYGERISRLWADAPWMKKKNKSSNFARGGMGGGYNNVLSGGRGGRGGSKPVKKMRLFQDRAAGVTISLNSFMGPNAENISPRHKMNLHNNDVGRRIIRLQRQKKCKCHGVSSSCNVKTCWEALPPLMDIGQVLKDKYNHATEVKHAKKRYKSSMQKLLNSAGGGNDVLQQQRSNKGDAFSSSSSAAAMLKINDGEDDDDNDDEDEDDEAAFQVVGLLDGGRVSPTDLVYIRKSPDYCTADLRIGSLGTRGRECNATSTASSNCDSMCCGRGYSTMVEERVENCQCKYVHCCYVKCKQCTRTVHRHFCK